MSGLDQAVATLRSQLQSQEEAAHKQVRMVWGTWPGGGWESGTFGGRRNDAKGYKGRVEERIEGEEQLRESGIMRPGNSRWSRQGM